MECKYDEYLVDIIQEATEKALCKLFENYKENFYYCSMITTGEGLCPIISAWSYEALEREAEATKEDDIEEVKYYLKWSYEESPYFAYGEEYFEKVKEVFNDRMKKIISEESKKKEYELRINSMEKVMSNLDKKGMFGSGIKRKKIVINAEVMPPDYTNTERAIRLNPKEAIEDWIVEIAEEL